MCKLNGRFGWSSALLDINADGLMDLAVGAPSDDSSLLQYHGAVYIYLGQPDAAPLPSQPNVIIRCTVYSIRCPCILTPSVSTVSNCYCLKRSASYWCNPPVMISDSRALWRSVPNFKNQNWWVKPGVYYNVNLI